MKVLLILMFTFMFSACATAPDFSYDPNEVKMMGRISAKDEDPTDIDIEAARAERLSARKSDYTGQVVASVLIGVATGLIILPLPDYGTMGIASGKPIQYHVVTEQGSTLGVFSRYGGFKVNDCVIVFLSQNMDQYPPRIAFSSQACEF